MKGHIFFAFASTLCLISLFGCVQHRQLMLKKNEPAICLELTSGKMWQVTKAGPFSTIEDAKTFAASLSLGGYDDWRLPTKYELFLLFQTVNRRQGDECDLDQTGEYWSIERDGSADLGHWETYILCDVDFTYIKALQQKGYVRAVRP